MIEFPFFLRLLPYAAFVGGIHGRTQRAVVGSRKIPGVRQRSQDPDGSRRMDAGPDLGQRIFWTHRPAPDLGVVQEEQLVMGQIQSGQLGFFSVLTHPFAICLKWTDSNKFGKRLIQNLNSTWLTSFLRHIIREVCFAYSYPKRLFESSVVGDIFTLRHPSVDVQSDLFDFVPGILINDALGSFSECAYRRVVPPLHHIPVFVELSSYKHNTFRNRTL